MGSPATAAITPPRELPVNFDGWDEAPNASASAPPAELPADFGGWDKPSASAPKESAPSGPTIGPAPPKKNISLGDIARYATVPFLGPALLNKQDVQRAKEAVLGNPKEGESAIGRAAGLHYSAASEKETPATELPIIRPSTLTPEEGIGRGVAQTAEGLTTAPNLLMAVGTGGAMGMAGTVSRIIPRLVSAGFSADMLHNAYQSVPAFKQAIDAGDYDRAKTIATSGALTAVMGIAAGAHALHGAGAPDVKAETPPALPPPPIPEGREAPAPDAETYMRNVGVNKQPPPAQASAQVFQQGPTYAELFDQADKLAAKRARTTPTVPETGVPENVARTMDARERLTSQLVPGKKFADLENSDRMTIDDLVSQGYGFASGEPPTAETPTIPEHEATIAAQLDQLKAGDRRAVMIPIGTFVPKGIARSTSMLYVPKVGRFVFDSKAITPREIKAAIKENRLPDILGATEGGMGVPDKSELQPPVTAVVGKDATGETVQGTIADQASLPQAIAQTAKVTPPGGTLGLRAPEQEIADRLQPQEGVVDGRRVLLQEDGKPLSYLDEAAPGTPIRAAEERPTINQEDGKPLAYDTLPADASEGAAEPGTSREGAPVYGSRPPSGATLPGEPTEILVPGGGEPLKGHYEVRELSDLYPSHNGINFQPNPDYWYANDRDYNDPRNRGRVVNQATNFEPRFLVTDNPDAGNGPPVVTADGNVTGGNSRVMTLQRVYDSRPEAVDKYRNLIARRASMFGIDPEQVSQLKQPVLVRVLDGADVASKIQDNITDLNKTGTSSLTSSERAISDARRMPPELLENIGNRISATGESGTLAQALAGNGGREVLQQLQEAGIITESETNAYFNKKGELTDAAKDRVSKLLLGRLFDEPSQIDATPPALQNKLVRIVGQIARTGARPDWDLTPTVQEAVSILRDADARGIKNLDDLAKQQGMFEDGNVANEPLQLAKAIKEWGVRDLESAFKRYAGEEVLSRPGAPATMFEPPTREESFASSFEKPSGEKGAIPADPLGVVPFFEKDVKPTVEKLASGSKEAISSIVHRFAPTAGVEPRILDELRRLTGTREAEQFIIHRQLEQWTKAVNGLSDQGMIDFIDRQKTGKTQATPELQQLSDFLRKTDDAVYKELQKYKPSTNYLENHFRVLWDKIPGANKSGKGGIFSRRPLQGSQGMLRQHTLDTISEGLKLGGVPVTLNPIRMFELSYADSMKYITAQRMWDSFGDMGLRKFASSPKDIPDGFVPLDDRIAKVYFKTPEGLLAKGGEWYVDKGAGRLLNNFLSRDLIRENAIGQGLLAVKNGSTAAELAISPFHAIFEANETIGSSIGSGLRRIVNLGFRQGRADQLLKGVGEILSAPLEAIPGIRKGGVGTSQLGERGLEMYADFDKYSKTAEGKQLLKEYPNARELVQDGFNAGLKPSMPEDYRIRAYQSFQETAAKALREGNMPGAMLRAIPAANELIMKPLFEQYIPHLKWGMFMRDYSLALEEVGDRIAKGEVSQATVARKVADSVENRFGEMNFDNLYWNRTFKTALQLMFRSVTWKLGNIRAYKDALVGQTKELARPFQGKGAPNLDPNMGWLLGMSLWTAALGGAIHTIATGKKPEQMKDFIYPIIDKASGIRVSVPTYWRDMVSAAHSPLGYVKSGMSGEIGRVADIWQNKDFYGNEVYSADDPLPRKTLDVIEHLFPIPFSVASAKQAKQQGGSEAAKVAGYAGFTKAPSWLEQTPMQQRMRQYMNDARPTGSRTRQQAQSDQLRADILRGLRRGTDMTGVIDTALQHGMLSGQQVRSMYRGSMEDPDARGFQRMNINQATDLISLANKDERERLMPMMTQKAWRALANPAQWTPKTITAVKGLGLPTPAGDRTMQEVP